MTSYDVRFLHENGIAADFEEPVRRPNPRRRVVEPTRRGAWLGLAIVVGFAVLECAAIYWWCMR